MAKTHRQLCFAGFCVVVVAGIIAYALHAKARTQRAVQTLAVTPVVEAKELPLEKGFLAFRNTAPGPGHGCLSFVPLDSPETTRAATSLACDRVYAVRGGGVALQTSGDKMFTHYRTVLFDAEAKIKTTFRTFGVPSRARMAPNGKYAATTVFTRGDSYNSAGFSTRTMIFDVGSSKLLGDIEFFSVEKDGQPFKRIDFNLWGVTFLADTDEFYATLATGGEFYLVRGSVSQRRMKVIRGGVECPSLSPDGTRIAYKARTTRAGGMTWKLRVLNLATGEERTVNEERSVDDQAEWLDGEHLLYGLPRNLPSNGSSDIWMARVDGTGSPRVFVRDAWSPSVVRPIGEHISASTR